MPAPLSAGAGSEISTGAGTLGLPITTTGSWLTDSQGRVTIVRGMNVADITPAHATPSEGGFGEDDARFLSGNGFNVVRLGVSWSRLQPRPGVYDDTYLESLEQSVQTLGRHGIVSLLDMHENVGPEWATGGPLPPSTLPVPDNFFSDPVKNAALDKFWNDENDPNGVPLQSNYAQMMEHLAARFTDNPAVLGIEIMNEPLPGNQYKPILDGSNYFESQQLTLFYNRVAQAIRRVNPTVPLFIEPAVTATLQIPVRLAVVHDPNIVLSFHDYVYTKRDGALLPDANILADNALAYAKAHGIPAMMTEFGSTSNQSFIAAELQPTDQNAIGWTEWSYSDTTYGGIDGTPEWLVKDPNWPPVADNINTATLRTLARPYAQVIAGIPGPFSFDGENFRFSYSTRRADGHGTFPAGSESTIAVPPIWSRNGYRVNVTGGHVTSAPDALTVDVASDGTADTIAVTVSIKS